MNDEQRKIETESLTKAVYYIGLSKVYLDDFRRDCQQGAKRQAGLWVNKIDFLLSDIYSALTPAARELYHEEINKGDILFTQSISEKWIRMTANQRELLETMCDALIKGEQVTFEKA